MEKLLLPLFGKRIKTNGKVVYQSPSSAWKQKVFDKLASYSFRKHHKKLQNFPIGKLNEVLDDLVKHFENENHAYVANMYSEEWDGVQIVHPYLNQDKLPDRSQEFGFSVYLTFDFTFDEKKELHQKFIEEGFEGFESFVFDELVRCYDLNCGMDKKLVFDTLKRYYQNVLGYDENTLYYFDAGSQGIITLTNNQ